MGKFTGARLVVFSVVFSFDENVMSLKWKSVGVQAAILAGVVALIGVMANLYVEAEKKEIEQERARIEKQRLDLQEKQAAIDQEKLDLQKLQATIERERLDLQKLQAVKEEDRMREKILLANLKVMSDKASGSYTIDVTVKNDGGRLGTITEIRFAVLEFSTAPDALRLTSYIPPSHKYPENDLSIATSQGAQLSFSLSQEVSPGKADRFQVTVSATEFLAQYSSVSATWILRPTLVTSGGEINGKPVTLKFSKSHGEFVARALVPRVNLIRFHGALTSNSSGQQYVTMAGRYYR